MQLDWITDPHLDHLKNPRDLIKFMDLLHNRSSEALLITGDLAESDSIYDFLGLLIGAYQRPIYFVLGNHDYYGNEIAETKQAVRGVCRDVPEGLLNWLTEAEPIWLNETTVLIGHDGFYDGQCGLGSQTDLGMRDFTAHGIPDLARALALGTPSLFKAILSLAVEATAWLEAQLVRVLQSNPQRVLLATHVPPFHEASYFRGKPSDARSAPYYVNKILGDMLRIFTANHPQVTFEVYAGHTHSKRCVPITSNLNVYVGTARYTTLPQFQLPIQL